MLIRTWNKDQKSYVLCKVTVKPGLLYLTYWYNLTAVKYLPIWMTFTFMSVKYQKMKIEMVYLLNNRGTEHVLMLCDISKILILKSLNWIYTSILSNLKSMPMGQFP